MDGRPMSDNHRVPTSPTDNTTDPALRESGDALMRRRRWAEAASAFERVPDRDPATEMKRRVSANLAALERRHHDIYEQLVSLPAQQQYTVAATASGMPTIVHRRPDGT